MNGLRPPGECAGFHTFYNENRERPELQRRFGGRLKEKSFENGKRTSGRHKGDIEWYGIGLAGGPKGPPHESPANRQQMTTPRVGLVDKVDLKSL